MINYNNNDNNNGDDDDGDDGDDDDDDGGGGGGGDDLYLADQRWFQTSLLAPGSVMMRTQHSSAQETRCAQAAGNEANDAPQQNFIRLQTST